MRRATAFLAAVACLALAAPPALAEVKTQEITFKSGDDEVKGFLAEPDGKGPHPAIVVIQEWWGLNDWVKDKARRLAAEGYVCLAPDLYRGKVTDNPMVARRLASGLPRDRALRDLEAAVDALAGRDNVDKERIGSIGWCMGGGFSLQLALRDQRIKACVICYGRVETDPDKLRSLNAAVLGIFGEEDMGIKAADVRKFESALKEAGKKVERIHLFENAGHGFMREGKANREYRPEATRKAWEEIEAFFAKTLKK